MAMGKRRNVQSTIPIVASTKKTPEESKKAKEATLYPSHRIWRWSESTANVIFDNWLRSQSSFDRRTRSKSKSGSSALPQKNLEDHGSIKLSILVGEWTSWLFMFLHISKPRPITNCTRVHTERKQNGWQEQCNAVWTGRKEMKTSPFFDSYCKKCNRNEWYRSGKPTEISARLRD